MGWPSGPRKNLAELDELIDVLTALGALLLDGFTHIKATARTATMMTKTAASKSLLLLCFFAACSSFFELLASGMLLFERVY